MIILDTQIWVWWVQGDERLTRKYQEWLQEYQSQGLGVSIISCWEVAKLVEIRKLTLPDPVDKWLETALAYLGVQLLHLTIPIITDVEAAIPEALSSGGFFFADIQNNQVDAAGLAILRLIAAKGEGAIASRKTILQQFPDADSTLNLLLQRELIEEVGDGDRFQVELIRRWFAH